MRLPLISVFISVSYEFTFCFEGFSLCHWNRCCACSKCLVCIWNISWTMVTFRESTVITLPFQQCSKSSWPCDLNLKFLAVTSFALQDHKYCPGFSLVLGGISEKLLSLRKTQVTFRYVFNPRRTFEMTSSLKRIHQHQF